MSCSIKNGLGAFVPLILTACAAAPELIKENDASVVFFELVNAENAFTMIRSVAPTAVDADREAELVTHCGGVLNETTPTVQLQAYSTKLHVSPAGSFTGKNLLKEYAALWSPKPLTTSFYREVGTDGGPVPKWTCFRLVRAVCRQVHGNRAESQCVFESDDVHTDLIGEFKLVDGDALKIRPLRLYYHRSIAEADEAMGISVEVKANAVWRDVNRGQEERVFSGHLLHERLAVTEPNAVTGIRKSNANDPRVKYYPRTDSAWMNHPRLPIIPWSTSDGLGTPTRSGDAGVVTLSVEVAEVGRAPEVLSALDNVVTQYGDVIGKQLLKAAQTAYEAEIREP